MDGKLVMLEIMNRQGHEEFKGDAAAVLERIGVEMGNNGKWLHTRGASWLRSDGKSSEIVTRVEDVFADRGRAIDLINRAESIRLMAALAGGGGHA